MKCKTLQKYSLLLYKFKSSEEIKQGWSTATILIKILYKKLCVIYCGFCLITHHVLFTFESIILIRIPHIKHYTQYIFILCLGMKIIHVEFQSCTPYLRFGGV